MLKNLSPIALLGIAAVGVPADRTLNIAPRKGSYKGMLQHRRFHIVLVGADSGTGDQPMQASKSVETALAQDNKGIYSWSKQIKSKSIAQFCLIYAEKQPCGCVFS